MNLPHLAQRVFNTPLMLHPQKAEVVMTALMERFGITQVNRVGAWVDEDDGFFTRKGRERDAGYDVLEGVAVIAVHGTLVQKLGSLRPYSGMTGYDGIRQTFLTALCDPEVKAICLDIDSPGGEVAGCFDLVDLMYASRGKKPVHAILTENAYSAAYAIASAADRIVVPRTGGVGSVGVIYIHFDWSQRIEKDGVQVNIITFGDRKAETNPLRPLSEAARAGIQASVDAAGQLFVSTVARNRNLAESVVRNTQAACLMADEGVRLGLADAVLAPDEAFMQLINQTGVNV
ncbi:serine peptidase [Serratia marcescens]|uniref:S49 family peptidase n=1 Tax=Serratia marcescens TaxID=615 RepID=UPI00062C46C2|nr:S49 family peptidase [Serratia marcescens]KKZ18103.1 serine peptidase [Serratia marcescens]